MTKEQIYRLSKLNELQFVSLLMEEAYKMIPMMRSPFKIGDVNNMTPEEYMERFLRNMEMLWDAIRGLDRIFCREGQQYISEVVNRMVKNLK